MKRRLWTMLLALIMVVAVVPVTVFAAEPGIVATDCGHFAGAEWAGKPGAYSFGWQYQNINSADITAIRVGAKDGAGQLMVEYTADAEQIAWQIANGYITAAGMSSAPFYKENNGTPLAEGRDLDWTAKFGPAFDAWQPRLFYVEAVAGGQTYYAEMPYNYAYPTVIPTDCGHFTSATWAGEEGAYSFGWRHENLDISTITGITVGCKDAKDRLIVQYTADAEQIAWQITNSYITATGPSSAPFYKENNGTPLAEGRDLDWTVKFGEGFDNWQPTLFYVEIIANGNTLYAEMPYSYPYPTVKATDCGHFTGAAWAGEPGAFSFGWQYQNMDPATITAITVGCTDAKGRLVAEYTADAEQIAYHIANGYITSDGLTSVPFYKENNGTPLAEGRDLDWTVDFGEGFATFQPTRFYVDVVAGGKTYHDEMAYNYNYPHVHELISHDAKAPTCTEKGWDAYETCVDGDYTTYVEKPALGHSPELVGAKAATCATEGYTGDEVCAVCDTVVEKGAVIAKSTTHGETKLVGAKEASCYAEGYTGDKVCTVCDTVAEKGSVIAKSTTHGETKLVGAKEASCYAEGYTGDKVCTVCNTVTEKGTVIKATGKHDYDSVVTPPTATDKGYTTHTCKMEGCGDTYVDAYTNPAVYKVTSGDKSVWEQRSPKTVTMTCNGPMDKFLGLQLDGKDVDPKHYNVKEGSTVVELKKSLLDSLVAGHYDLKFVYTDGYADATFTVMAKAADDTNATTGDTFPMLPVMAVMLLSLTGAAVLMFAGKNRYRK